MRNGHFIDLSFKFVNKYNLYFRDSLLLLPGSLSSLAKNFGTSSYENKRVACIFPYKFVNNEQISLNYIDPAPAFKFFDGISQDEYNSYSSQFNNNWNLKSETIKYCELDCYVLYQIIDKFSCAADNIFKMFRIDLLKYPTLSSLAFAIYRSKFLKDDAQIPLIHGEIYEFIKKSYTGGSVDVYKPIPTVREPKVTEETLIRRYDVNSLYPFAMKEFPMPSDNPVYFEGDIMKTYNHNNDLADLDKPFGIFEVDIETPKDIKIPLLQTKVKVKNGTYRTIAPIGNWTGCNFSDKLYNTARHGYTFKVKRGYLFEKADLFSDYINFLFDLKQNSEAGSPYYIISKLLLNSLYGRMGMNPISEQHKIVTSDEALELYPKINVTNILNLKNG